MLTKEYSAKSLFEVLEIPTTGDEMVVRCADVQGSTLSKIAFRDNDPKIFDNRERLYLKNQQLPIGTVGILDWNVVPNKRDDSKDWLTTSLDYNLAPTVIIILSDSNVRALIAHLQEGIPYIGKLLGPVILVSKDLGIECKGMYFPKDALIQKENLLKPCLDILTAEIVDLSNNQVLCTRSKRVLDSLDKPYVIDNVDIKDGTTIVRDIFLKRATNKDYLRSIGYSQNDRRKFRDFLSRVSTKTIVEEVSDTCKCSEKNAEMMVDNLIRQANAIFTKDDMDQSLMEKLIESNSVLSEDMYQMVEQKWKIDNQEKLEEAQNQIRKSEKNKKNVDDEIQRAQKTLDEINHKIGEKQTKLAELEKQARMGDEIQEKVRQKITAARQDVTAFLAEMVFLQAPIPNTTADKTQKTPESSHAQTSNISLTDPEESLFIKESYGLTKEDCSDWTEVLEILCQNLEEAGAANQLSMILAKILYAIFMNEQNVLLIGPNAEASAQAASAALSGKPCDILNCRGDYQKKYVLKANSEAGKVILVENLFSSRWIDSIGDIVNCLRGHWLIFTAPFVEDLSIEPASLLNFMVPIFTEPYMESLPKCNFFYVDWSKEIRNLNVSRQVLSYDNLLNKLGIGRYAKIMLERIIGKMKGMGHSSDHDDIYSLLFPIYSLLLPIAQLRGKRTVLEDYVKENEEIPEDQRKKILTQLGEW
ncbi:coiled-coil domain-containing protein [Blautia massiliensis (ex Durand et al. 2017)]|uniref:coiled-coil domain-containing protein n=1 Tax=Blautia massiliensis (ex Durand et al. 2017) TaxID=1737424 RepID=UPI002430FD60|nr:hypothetical protein [Blautia massiliensis (ex Durand et al. 2017)]MDD6549080.1 hypothetical protein [Blautia massiliensis (ex Durand et al. 2017)]